MEHTNITLKIPKYTKEDGLQLEWEGDYFINIKTENNSIVLQANEAGLKSLAKHLLALSEHGVPDNTHIHFDELNSLELGSQELIIEKIR